MAGDGAGPLITSPCISLCLRLAEWPDKPPTAAQDGGDELESGMVEQQKYFETVRAVEAAGVCTRFPHPSQLYQQLLSKEWQPALCLMPQVQPPAGLPLISRSARCNLPPASL